jgi:hypothetical protein
MNFEPNKNKRKRTLIFADDMERLVYGRLLEKTGSLLDKWQAYKLLVDPTVEYPMPFDVSITQIGRVARSLAERHDAELEANRSQDGAYQQNPFMRVRDAVMVEAELTQLQN